MATPHTPDGVRKLRQERERREEVERGQSAADSSGSEVVLETREVPGIGEIPGIGEPQGESREVRDGPGGSSFAF